MRIHERFPVLWPLHAVDHVRDVLDAENLVAVRLEPVYSLRFEAYMDALFEKNGKWLVVPMLRVDGVSIMVPETPPVTWPARLAAFNGPQIDRIDTRILPWLRSIAAARLVNDEHVRFFRDTPDLREAYGRARDLDLIGASPYPKVMRSIAPAVYGLRLARDGRAALRGPHAANGAAILSTVAERLDVECSQFEREWFAGIEFGAINLGANYSLFVGPRNHPVEARYCIFDDGSIEAGERKVELAEPLPTDVMISFDSQDGPIARTFAVTECGVLVRSLPFFEPAVMGGSRGRIALVVRDDAERFPDADTDAAEALAKRLCAEGFDATVTIASKVDVDHTDIAHLFGLRHGASVAELLQATEERGVPLVVKPYADDRSGEAISGASGSLLIPRVSSDVITFYDFVAAFERRKISNLSTGTWYDDISAMIMRRCSVALVAAPSETQFLRERFGYYGGTILAPAWIPLTPPTADIGSLIGSDEYILIHAPLEPRCNQVFAVLAAQRLGLPLVLLGPIADVEYYRYINEVAGPLVCQLRDEDLTDAEISGLYARARIVADVSWSARGLDRLARGAAFGAGIVAAASGYTADVWSGLGCSVIDPGSLDSIVEGLRTTWERQPVGSAKLISGTAALADPFTALVAVVSAYQQAAAGGVQS